MSRLEDNLLLQKSKMECHRNPSILAAMTLLVVALFLVSTLLVSGTAIAVADDTWKPFAEKDRRAAERAARRRDQTQDNAGRDPRGPFLEPMNGFDPIRNTPPQPYPATPPDFRSAQPYTPAFQDGRPVPVQPGVAYGAPGTYVPEGAAINGNLGAAAPRIERGELTPVISPNGGLPNGVWQGLDANAVEQLIGPMLLPPRSPALSDLLTRIISEPVADQPLNAIRLAALVKAGRFQDAASTSNVMTGETGTEPVLEALHAKLELVSDKTDEGCSRIKITVAEQDKLPKQLRGEAIILAGYCAILSGNTQAAGLAAELARDAGYNRPFTLAILEAIASGDRVSAPLPTEVTVLDALLIGRLKQPDPALLESMLPRANAGFLGLISRDRTVNPAIRLLANERAAAANIVTPAALADAYRSAVNQPDTPPSNALERARHLVSAERQQAQFSRTRAIRALLDSAIREGLYHPVAVAASAIVREMRPAPEISWFNETAIEILAASGDYNAARQWVLSEPTPSGGNIALDHWLMLLDIADPEVRGANRGKSLIVLENLALQGIFTQPALHRLATVLDALDYNVPIPLWNLASRTQQPQTGHLPETGILSAMKQASEACQVAATALYAIRTIGPSGTSGAHLLGLGDTIRALKRAGLEKDARRLGFEALFGDWPRTRR